MVNGRAASPPGPGPRGPWPPRPWRHRACAAWTSGPRSSPAVRTSRNGRCPGRSALVPVLLTFVLDADPVLAVGEVRLVMAGAVVAMIGTFSSGSGSPARTIASRRRVSCGESDPTRMSLMASLALRRPRFPLCRSIIRWRSAKSQSGMSLPSSVRPRHPNAVVPHGHQARPLLAFPPCPARYAPGWLRGSRRRW